MRYVVLGTLLFLATCFGGEDDLPLWSTCGEDDGCATGLTCLYGRCRSLCTMDIHCDEGQCVVDASGQSFCANPDIEGPEGCSDCEPPNLCVGGQCVAPLPPGDGDADADADADDGGVDEPYPFLWDEELLSAFRAQVDTGVVDWPPSASAPVLDASEGAGWALTTSQGGCSAASGSFTVTGVELTRSGAAPVCVVVVDRMEVASTSIISITGDGPAAILSRGDIIIDGTILAIGWTPFGGPGGGAGGDPTLEADGESPGGDAGGGGRSGESTLGGFAGGGGGGHFSRGGDGGLSVDTLGGGGAPFGTCEDVELIGGAGGGAGFSPVSTSNASDGGGGGGVVYLFSLTSIEIGAEGSVDVYGGPGGAMEPLVDSESSGGGGAGGTVVLEAPVVTFEGSFGVNASGGTGGDLGAIPGGSGGWGGSEDGEDGLITTFDSVELGTGGGGGVGIVHYRTGSSQRDLAGHAYAHECFGGFGEP